MDKVTIIDTSFVQDSLSHLRYEKTGTALFRHYADRLSYLLLLNAIQAKELVVRKVKTPIATAEAKVITGNFIIVPVLRSGIAMLYPSLQLFPDAKVGFVGLFRDEATAVAQEYYWNIPKIGKNDSVLIIDPMLATGGTILHVLKKIMLQNPKDVRIVSIVATPQGIKKVHDVFPEIQIIVASVDKSLNNKKYIVPGLGDFGDRYFGT